MVVGIVSLVFDASKGHSGVSLFCERLARAKVVVRSRAFHGVNDTLRLHVSEGGDKRIRFAKSRQRAPTANIGPFGRTQRASVNGKYPFLGAVTSVLLAVLVAVPVIVHRAGRVPRKGRYNVPCYS